MFINFPFEEKNWTCPVVKVSILTLDKRKRNGYSFQVKQINLFKEECLRKIGTEEKEYLYEKLHLYYNVYNICQNPSNSPTIKELNCKEIIKKGVFWGVWSYFIIKINFID